MGPDLYTSGTRVSVSVFFVGDRLKFCPWSEEWESISEISIASSSGPAPFRIFGMYHAYWKRLGTKGAFRGLGEHLRILYVGSWEGC